MAQPAIPGLSSDQLHRLLSLMDTPIAGYEKLSEKSHWMLDSDASCHMAGDVAALNDLGKISSIEIDYRMTPILSHVSKAQ